VSSWGPYNRFGATSGGGAGDVSIDITSGASRNLEANVDFLAAGNGNAWCGSGCWFRVGTTGPARLRADFTTNGHCFLSATLGYASSHIQFSGSVWGASENAWVDRGGAHVDLVNRYMWAFDWFDMNGTSVTVTFDARAGGMYYCAGLVSIWTGIGGFASGGSRVLTVMNPLNVCVP
jgi:hypothetical protein